MSIAQNIRAFLGSPKNREWVRTRNLVYAAEGRCVRCSGTEQVWGPLMIGVPDVGPVAVHICFSCAHAISARDLIVIAAAMLTEHQSRTAEQ